VSECIAAVPAHIYAEDIKFEYASEAEKTEFVADRRAIRKIASNLLLKAAKFSPTFATVRLQLKTLPDGLIITVIDSGPGLTKPEIAQALGRFGLVANQAKSRAPRGAGVGLPLVKALTEAHGGSLQLESAQGNGLTASVWLPRP
jgi:signal transduction histidine kinase